MLNGLLYLLLFHFLGYVLVTALQLPVPAPVAGLLLLLVFLLVRGSVTEPLQQAAGKLLPFLPLFLIPASAGVIEHTDLLQDDWLPISVAIVVSVVLSFVMTPFIIRFYQRLLGRS